MLKRSADITSAASPVPPVEIKTSLAPGKRGPVGMSPRTDYSRINTGLPSNPDAGAIEQKSMAPRGAEMLPKIASEGSMATQAARPTINEMVKKAMAGSIAAVEINREAVRQAQNLGEKTASVAAPSEKVTTTDLEQAEKLAAALDFVADELIKEGSSLGGSKVEPGKGPGALHVMEAEADGKQPFKPGNQGHGHSGQVAHSPAEGKSTPTGPATQMANNMHDPAGFHGKQQTSMVNQKTASEEKCKDCGKEKCSCAKTASVAAGIRAVMSKTAGEDPKLEKKEGEGIEEVKKGLEKTEKAHEEEKKGFDTLATSALRQVKTAEDAINPAKISAGAATPPDTRESGQSGGVSPAGGQTSLVGSNQAAIDYKRSAAKSVPKADLKAMIAEPALSSATDKTLGMAFAHTGEAGTKFASAEAGSVKTAAARTLLQKLAAEADEKKNAQDKTTVATPAAG